MNIGLTSKRIAVRDTTREVFIPGNPKAKLMYYLNCISVVLNTNKISRYINYSQYYLIPDSEIPEIVALALLFSPEIMIKSGIFINEENLDLSNRFLEITGETIGIHANQEIVIGGIVVRVLKIMLFKKNWLINYYFDPLEYIMNPPKPLPLQDIRRNSDDDIVCCNIF